MRAPLITLISILMVMSTPLAAADNDASEKQKSILQLFEMTGVSKMMTQMAIGSFDATISNLQKQQRKMTSEQLKVVREVFTQTFQENSPSLLAQVAISYEKTFSKKEIDDLISFYQTPTGAKSLRVMPQLMQEGIQLGSQWAQQLMPIVLQRIRERLKKQAPPSQL